ncbi:hypothetical protein ACH82I_00620 [Brevibacterium sp. GP-SGM9]|uniref:hypothetical protein n=1 Tax=Brevibacterium sp. GP-SGM9 TaxID=3376990 RepID=UPI0039A71FFA
MHFEIVAGHADELRAIIDGSMSTAGMRYKNRLGATFERMAIPEWLSQVDGAPDAQQIAQLLDQLSVHEVLDRMRRLTPSFDYGSDTALHIVEAIKELQDEAAEFVSGGLSVQQNGTAQHSSIPAVGAGCGR